MTNDRIFKGGGKKYFFHFMHTPEEAVPYASSEGTAHQPYWRCWRLVMSL